MSCCGEIDLMESPYEPTSTRLLKFGLETYGNAMEEFPHTQLWLFSFIERVEGCMSCMDALLIVEEWFRKYGSFTDKAKHVKWVIEENPTTNLLWKDMGISTLPCHIFADSHGHILDIYRGNPTEQWLERHVIGWLK